ncbi:unnamed protein product [Urochloa humidicola]
MVCTKLTPHKSTYRLLPPHVHESSLVSSYRDAYQEWRRGLEEELLRRQQEGGPQQAQPEEEEEDPEEVEQLNSDSEREQEQLEHQQQRDQEQREEEQQQLVAGGEPGGDPDDDGDDDEDDEDEHSDQDEGEEHVERPPGWVVHDYTRDGGDCYYHCRLIKMLRRHYGTGNVGVEYHCQWWTHDHFHNFWRTKVQVRVPDQWARAARRMTEHSALSDRHTMEAGICDAARQAYYRYRQRLLGVIQNRPDRYNPRRERGETACTIASTAGVTDPQLVSTVSLVAVLNTDLDAVSEENHMLRNRITALEARIIELESQAGQPAPRSPEYHAESPPRKRARYGIVEARTTVENP